MQTARALLQPRENKGQLNFFFGNLPKLLARVHSGVIIASHKIRPPHSHEDTGRHKTWCVHRDSAQSKSLGASLSTRNRLKYCSWGEAAAWRVVSMTDAVANRLPCVCEDGALFV